MSADRVVPMHRERIADQATIPPEVRAKAQALHARCERVRRVLTSLACPPERLPEAAEELARLAADALDLRQQLRTQP